MKKIRIMLHVFLLLSLLTVNVFANQLIDIDYASKGDMSSLVGLWGGKKVTSQTNDNTVLGLSYQIINKTSEGVLPLDIVEKLIKTQDLTSVEVFDAAMALIALDCAKFASPDETLSTKEKIIEKLLNEQNADGSYSSLSGKESAEVTAMVITSLSKYNDISKISEHIVKGLNFIDSVSPAYSDSISAVIIARSALKQNESMIAEDIVKLSEYSNGDGRYSHEKGGETSVNSTAYAALAIYADENNGNIFDLSHLELKKQDNVQVFVSFFGMTIGLVVVIYVILLLVGKIGKKWGKLSIVKITEIVVSNDDSN